MVTAMPIHMCAHHSNSNVRALHKPTNIHFPALVHFLFLFGLILFWFPFPVSAFIACLGVYGTTCFPTHTIHIPHHHKSVVAAGGGRRGVCPGGSHWLLARTQEGGSCGRAAAACVVGARSERSCCRRTQGIITNSLLIPWRTHRCRCYRHTMRPLFFITGCSVCRWLYHDNGT
jgi:hypothetical protein